MPDEGKTIRTQRALAIRFCLAGSELVSNSHDMLLSLEWSRGAGVSWRMTQERAQPSCWLWWSVHTGALATAAVWEPIVGMI